MVSLRVAAVLVPALLLGLPGNAQIAHQSGISADIHGARPGELRSLQPAAEVSIPGPLRSVHTCPGTWGETSAEWNSRDSPDRAHHC